MKPDDILVQISKERLEIENAEKQRVEVGRVMRCHLCGKFVQELFPLDKFDSHSRMACENCHPKMRGVRQDQRHNARILAEQAKAHRNDNSGSNPNGGKPATGGGAGNQ